MTLARRGPLYFYLLLGVFLMGLAGAANAEEAAPPAQMALSPGDKTWLAAHPVIRLGIDASYAPYSFLDDQGKLQGVVPEFLTYLQQALGIRFEITADLTWPQLMEAVQEGRLDAVATVVRLPEREAFLAFTRIYLPTPLVIMTRDKAPQLRSVKELEGLRLALVEGYSSSRQVMALHPNLRPFLVTKPVDGLGAVATGTVDAYVGVLGVNTYLSAQHGITNLKVNAAFDMADNGQRFGVRKDWPQLAHLLDKALIAMPAQRQAEIFQQWLPVNIKDIQRLSHPTLVTRLFPWLLGLVALAIVGYLVMLLWNRQLQGELSRRQLELKDSETRLKAAEAIAHMGHWEYRVADGLIQWSDEAYRIFGLEPQSLRPSYEDLLARIHPDDRNRHDDFLKRMLASHPGDKIDEFRFRLLRPDGSMREVGVLVRIEFGDDGRPMRLFGAVQDITERRQMEQRLRQQLDELTRWQTVMLGREDRIQTIKAEVNALLAKQGKPIRYPSQADPS
jgi:PAS domain S-box-containing protein